MCASRVSVVLSDTHLRICDFEGVGEEEVMVCYENKWQNLSE